MCEAKYWSLLFKSRTVVAKLWDTARAAARKITLEPAIILVAIMSGVGNGVKVQTNLQLWKVCTRIVIAFIFLGRSKLGCVIPAS